MTRFNPSDSTGGGGGRGEGDRGDGPRDVPPNDYLLAMVGFSVRTGRKSGKPYLNARYRVIHGEQEGAEFYSSLGIDTTNHNIANRLGVFCRCIGQEDEFDLEDKGDLMRVFIGKPFKAKVSRKEQNQYINNDVERYIPTVSDAERSIMRLFERNFRDTESSSGWGQSGGGTRGDDPQGDPFAGGDQRGASNTGDPSGGSGGSDPFDRNPPPHDDNGRTNDDIPF